MSSHGQILQLLVGVLSFQAVFHEGITQPLTLESAAPVVVSTRSVSARYQATSSIDFTEDDALDQAFRGFNAIYIDNRGNVLGTFINIPGAKLKFYASGQIEIAERDYTTEVDFRSNATIRAIGDVQFLYSSAGRIRSIGGIDFRYSSNGRLRGIANVELRYSSSGRLKEIDTVDFEYESSGVIRTISSTQTEAGINIVVVN